MFPPVHTPLSELDNRHAGSRQSRRITDARVPGYILGRREALQAMCWQYVRGRGLRPGCIAVPLGRWLRLAVYVHDFSGHDNTLCEEP